MNIVEKLADRVSQPGRLSRRSFFGRAAKASAAVAAAATGAGVWTKAAYAYDYRCCTLAYGPPWCSSDYYSGTCPCATTSWEWVCWYGGCPWVCGECYDCNCSYSYPSCAPGCPCSPQAPQITSPRFMFAPRRAPGQGRNDHF